MQPSPVFAPMFAMRAGVPGRSGSFANARSRILTYNLKSPSPQLHKLPLDIETELQRLG